jgi:hypothetical protein
MITLVLTDTIAVGRCLARIEFKLADCWIGAYWAKQGDDIHVWVCLLPCLPIHLIIRRNE